jgi:hypothetical protein
MTDEERAAELERLTRLMTASKNAGAGYGKRIEAIQKQIDALNGQ